MIKSNGVTPYIIWHEPTVEWLDKERSHIARDLIPEILEDAAHGIYRCSISYLFEGCFKIIAENDNTNLEALKGFAMELKQIIKDYDLEDYR